MTTLRRELRTKFEEILLPALSDNPQTQDAIDYATGLAEKLSDAALSVAGIAKNESKFTDPMWDVLHGRNPEGNQQSDEASKIESVVALLETELKYNFPRDTKSQGVYRRILYSGKSVKKFVEWVKAKETRLAYAFLYAKDPETIWRDFPQAFSSSDAPGKNIPNLERGI